MQARAKFEEEAPFAYCSYRWFARVPSLHLTSSRSPGKMKAGCVQVAQNV